MFIAIPLAACGQLRVFHDLRTLCLRLIQYVLRLSKLLLCRRNARRNRAFRLIKQFAPFLRSISHLTARFRLRFIERLLCILTQKEFLFFYRRKDSLCLTVCLRADLSGLFLCLIHDLVCACLRIRQQIAQFCLGCTCGIKRLFLNFIRTDPRLPVRFIFRLQSCMR